MAPRDRLRHIGLLDYDAALRGRDGEFPGAVTRQFNVLVSPRTRDVLKNRMWLA